jgi:hypothetical protein
MGTNMTRYGEYGSDAETSVLVLADREQRARRAQISAEAIGARVQMTSTIKGGFALLESHSIPDAVLIEIEEDDGAILDRILGRINDLARENRVVAIASVYPAMIDPVAARFDAHNTVILCKPDEVERSTALTLILAERRHRLQDRASDMDSMQLHRLSEEVSRIARTLTMLSSGTELAVESRSGFSDAMIGYAAEPMIADQDQISSQSVRGMIRLRRLRDQYFPADMFADPAWDILLDLLAAKLERRMVAVSSLCIAASVPATTALRWIRTMTEHGLLDRKADPMDGRRVFIELSDSTAGAMTKYMVAAKKVGGLIV